MRRALWVFFTYLVVFAAGALAMYVYLWYDVYRTWNEVWPKIFTG